MTTIEGLSQKSISEMSIEEAQELLRTLRLSRRTSKRQPAAIAKRKAAAHKANAINPSDLSSDEAAKLLKLLGE